MVIECDIGSNWFVLGEVAVEQYVVFVVSAVGSADSGFGFGTVPFPGA